MTSGAGASKTIGVRSAVLAFAASLLFFLLLAAAVPIRDETVLIVVWGALAVGVMVRVARHSGPLYGVPLAVSLGFAFDSYYIPPTRDFSDWHNWLVAALYIGLGVVIGGLAAGYRRRGEAAEQARTALAGEQAALRRVATLVAEGVPPDELFDAVVREAGTLLNTDIGGMIRYEREDDAYTVVARWVADGEQPAVGMRWPLEGDDFGSAIATSHDPVRIDDYEGRPGRIAAFLRDDLGVRSSVGCPIMVEGAVWGGLFVHSRHPGPLPSATESRLENFTELVATAIANANAQTEVRRLAAEQAALRRVATLVASQASPGEVCAAVAKEVALLLAVDLSFLYRFEPDGSASIAANWGKMGPGIDVRSRLTLDGDSVAARVFKSSRPARIDDYSQVRGSIAERARVAGRHSAVGAPIVLDGKLWGAIVAATRNVEPLPPGTESRMEEFTKLVATAISNIEARSALAASRARVVVAADDERRRVVRDLHDGAQQRLVHTVVTLKLARRALEHEPAGAVPLLDEALQHAQAATNELRELVHGILPSALTLGGLEAGVEALASRMPIPVEANVSLPRLPQTVEATAYFIVAEALTNVAKHARAQHATVATRLDNGALHVEVSDDGVGGAHADGSGLLGLRDRLAAVDGTLWIESPVGVGTRITASIPV